MAPVLEELLFRGILQPWLAARAAPRRPGIGSNAGHCAIPPQLRLIRTGIDFAEQIQPVAFVVLMGFAYLALRGRQRSPVPGAIFSSSLFFAGLPFQLADADPALRASRRPGLPGVPHAEPGRPDGTALPLQRFRLRAVDPGSGSAREGQGGDHRGSVADPNRCARFLAAPAEVASAIGPSRGDTTDDVTCPTSCPSCMTFSPGAAGLSPSIFKPSSVRLTCPRSRAMTMGSCPR